MAGGGGRPGGVISRRGAARMHHRVLERQQDVGDTLAVRAVARAPWHAFAAGAAPAGRSAGDEDDRVALVTHAANLRPNLCRP